MAIARGAPLNNGLSVLIVGAGPPLVSIPGLGAGADLSVVVPRADRWSATALATATGRAVHQINRPLDVPVGTSIADVAGWYAVALRDRFEGPVDVFGASAGGVTALQLALDHPDVVRRLVVAIAHGIPGAELVVLPGRGHLTTLFDRRAPAAHTRFLRD
ncbi:alpha/beta fold hydrolase [Pseudonocardia sp. GCM10023141]|uniref:alpha/beta fold hydrolase n=1 Tax=Pseudonocardia sp. GCM10023141 TaxID=3252653 RepID=UPI0036218D6E